MIGKVICIPGSEKPKTLTYSSVSIEGTQQDSFCSYKIKQVFTNTTGENTDISYVFPNEPQFCTYETVFIVDGKEIKPTLRVKEEAKKEFEEAVEQGHHAMLGEEMGNGLNSFKLGNIPKDKTAEVHLKISFLADMNEKGIYYKFPLTTKYQKGAVTEPYSDKPGSFSFSINMKSTHELEKFAVSTEGQTNLVDAHNATFSTTTVPKMDCIIVEAPIKNAEKSVAVASDGYIAISTYPTFEGKVEANSEFYFIVDCSGSMGGSRINNARKCMEIFLQSLPMGCRIAIITFGSQHAVRLEPCDYTDDNMRRALQIVSDIQADMGGTEILEPIRYVSNIKPKDGYVKQIFLLTDGEVHNTDQIVATAQENRSSNRIFSIGLGNGADPGLVKGMARKSGGNYVLIKDDDNLTEKVISMLSSSIAPSATNITIQGDQNISEMWPSPCPPLFASNPATYIVKSQHMENVLISGSCTGNSVDLVVPVTKIADGLGLKQLFARYVIDDIESSLILKDDETKKKKCIELSLASNILCKYTAYLGIDFESHEDRQPSRGGFYGRPMRLRGGGPGPMLCCCAAAPMMMRAKCAAPRAMMAAPMANSIQSDSDSDCVPKPKCMPLSIQSDSDSDPVICSRGRSHSENNMPAQCVDGSWSSFPNIDPELEKKFGTRIAATVAAIAHIKKRFKDRIGEFTLILKKAFAYLKRQNNQEDWEQIVNKYI